MDETLQRTVIRADFSLALVVLPVAACEIAAAVALMAKGRAVKLGIVGAMLVLFGAMPLGWDEVATIVLVAGLALLLRHEYTRSIPVLVRVRRRRPSPAAHPAPQR
jgi:hypothetical protein